MFFWEGVKVENIGPWIFWGFVISIIIVIMIKEAKESEQKKEEERRREKEYWKLQNEVLDELGFRSWNIADYIDEEIVVKSRQTLDNYDDEKLFKGNKEKIAEVQDKLKIKSEIYDKVKKLEDDGKYFTREGYSKIKEHIDEILRNASAYRVKVVYVSPSRQVCTGKIIEIFQEDIQRYIDDPSLYMTKTEYNKYLKETQKGAVEQKQYEFYNSVNSIIEYANTNRGSLVKKDDKLELDKQISTLLDRTLNSIKKIKDLDSREWDIIDKLIEDTDKDVHKIVEFNQKILDYYASDEFKKIKNTCEALMSNQREFNEYIEEKAQSISKLFGTRVERNETIVSDEFNYIRPYKKTITPFTAEVSAQVFSSAENSPLEYVVKYFYPNKAAYPEQIQKLYRLVEEIETLKDAKQIIENYKAEYQQYLRDVPDYIWEKDEAGFYSRLGFANIDESVLTVEYRFSYTSGGGISQRSFTVPMTEENIGEIIKILESKLTASAFAKEQRNMMTHKLRETIKKRDNYTCCSCGNSTYKEPNLLLEIDHKIPVAKGGLTVEENLQTLCWKCNRAKSDKIV